MKNGNILKFCGLFQYDKYVYKGNLKKKMCAYSRIDELNFSGHPYIMYNRNL